uniref:Thymus, brain and testes associated n=1 Tax=Amphiprion percula TaxID=161767 RepID=A0A3P8TWP3_AMPPE
MLTAPDSQGTTGERSHNQINQDPFNTEFTKTLTKSSPHFGALSHHSFFSRHNPHPQRATHIQGLNGRPICMVRDDWCVTSSLFPHPLLKSHVLRKSPGPAFTFPLTQNPMQSAETITNQVRFKCDQPEDEFVCQKTQYSADTGRIIPPSSKSYLHRSHSQHLKYPQPFQDQELTVLELLCQILQTDSLSTVQQWLLLAGQRGKTRHSTWTAKL